MNRRQLYALTNPLETPADVARLRTVTRIDRGANMLVVILAVDR